VQGPEFKHSLKKRFMNGGGRSIIPATRRQKSGGSRFKARLDKVSETPSQPISPAWWFTSVIPDTQEV
jgi:hypothetical protein